MDVESGGAVVSASDSLGLADLEQVTLTSVGLDVGSSTTHLTVSRIRLQRRGAELSTRFEVTERTVLFESPVRLTPYRTDGLIDGDRLAGHVAEAYDTGGWT